MNLNQEQIDRMSRLVRERNRKAMKKHYEREANKSALLFAGIITLLSFWLWAELGFPPFWEYL